MNHWNGDEYAAQIKYQSKFSSKPNAKCPKRFPLAEIPDQNIIDSDQKIRNRFDGQRHMLPNPSFNQQIPFKQSGKFTQKRYDPVERMFPPDPPEKFEGYRFIPSKKNDLDIEIELEPIILRRPTQWY